jgi:hypothetical protein
MITGSLDLLTAEYSPKECPVAPLGDTGEYCDEHKIVWPTCLKYLPPNGVRAVPGTCRQDGTCPIANCRQCGGGPKTCTLCNPGYYPAPPKVSCRGPSPYHAQAITLILACLVSRQFDSCKRCDATIAHCTLCWDEGAGPQCRDCSEGYAVTRNRTSCVDSKSAMAKCRAAGCASCPEKQGCLRKKDSATVCMTEVRCAWHLAVPGWRWSRVMFERSSFVPEVYEESHLRRPQESDSRPRPFMPPQGECTCVHGRSLHCGEYETSNDNPDEPLEYCVCCTAGYMYLDSGSCVKKPQCTATQYLDEETGECLDW